MYFFPHRLAHSADLSAIQELIPRSVRGLNDGLYTTQQIDAALVHLFGVDTQLIADGTYYVIESDMGIAACGGWSKRATLYGGDQFKQAGPLLAPATDAAKIHAFFVEPHLARRGLGRQLLDLCVNAASKAGFKRMELGATLPGVALYRAYGFTEVERIEQPMPGGLTFPLVKMHLAR